MFRSKVSTLACLTLMFCYAVMTTYGIAEEPIRCTATDCTITNSYGEFPDRAICKAASASYPGTEQELIQVVASATKARAKIKVATQFSHSIPKLVCPDGDEGWLVSTKNLTRVLGVDRAKMEMTVESGVTLKQLINEAANVGMALPYSPYWSGLTVGGMLGTGAHGSSLWGDGSSVHDYVVRVRVVSPGSAEDGYVKVRELDSTNNLTDLNAVRTNLGVLGIISQMTFKLQPIFKRSITYDSKSDADLADRAADFGHQHEFADITWYLSQGKAVYRVDDRVPSTTPGDGLFDFTGFRAQPSFVLGLVRSTEEAQEVLQFADGKCASATITSLTLITTAFGLTNFNDILFTGYPVIGYQNRLQSSSSCLDGQGDNTCPWDPRANGEYFFQTTFSVSLTKVKSFIQDVQSLAKLVPKSMCGMDLYLGILMRYVKASNSFLGKEEDSIDFDMTYYRSKDPMTPRLFEDVYEEIEQMGIFKYGGLPHWGKNRNLAFVGAFDKYKNGKEFLKIKERYDPSGLFSSEWTDQVLGLKDGLTKDADGCALEGLCICSKDSHCAPSKGYLCKPGRIYTDARVCRKD
uniref:L-gulonolactone oxidase n=1 Tax=Kalanchoe fedtschenkoi TaxID=63787 RepID=A0A7N0V041_KALFE